MLTHAFDVASCQGDAENRRSQPALTDCDFADQAQFEGIRRAHIPAVDGGLRDTAYYAILREEWPYIRQNLSGRLKAYN